MVVFIKGNVRFISENRKLIQFISTETKYLNDNYLQHVLKMEQNSTIQTYYELLCDVDKEIPIHEDLEIVASLLAYTVAFYALKSWSVKTKPLESINQEILLFCLKGLGNQVFLESQKYL